MTKFVTAFFIFLKKEIKMVVNIVLIPLFFPHKQILGILLSDFVRGDGGGKRKKEEPLSYARMVGKRLFFL